MQSEDVIRVEKFPSMRTNAPSGRSFHEDFRPYIGVVLIAPNRAA
jgi:hypothetical protein